MTRMHKIAIGVIVLFMVTTTYGLNSLRIDQKNMRNEISRNQVHIINNVSNISRTVSNTMRNIEEEQKWLRSADFEIYKLDDKYEKLKVVYTVQLNEFDENDSIYLILFNEKEDTNEKILMIKNEDSLDFKANFELDTAYNYRAEVLRKSGSVSKTEGVRDIAINNIINNAVMINGSINGGSYDHSSESGYFDFEVSVIREPEAKQMKNLKMDFEITDVKADVYYKKEKLDTIDLINDESYSTDQRNGRSVREFSPYEDVIVNYLGQYKFEEIEDEDFMFTFAIIVTATDSNGREYKEYIGEFFEYEGSIEDFEKEKEIEIRIN